MATGIAQCYREDRGEEKERDNVRGAEKGAPDWRGLRTRENERGWDRARETKCARSSETRRVSASASEMEVTDDQYAISLNYNNNADQTKRARRYKIVRP